MFERCLFWRDVCIYREMSVLERCLYYRDICIREVCVLKDV